MKNLLPLIICFCAFGVAKAEDEKPKKLSGDFAFGGSFTSGTNESYSWAMNGELKYSNQAGSLKLFSQLNEGKSKNGNITTTAADLKILAGRYDFNISPRWFAFSGLEARQDRTQGIKLRQYYSGGLGYKFLDSEKVKLSGFIGPSYTINKYTNKAQSEGFQSTFIEELSFQIFPSTLIEQKLEYSPASNGTTSFGTFKAKISTQIIDAWNLTIGDTITYSAISPQGIENTQHLVNFGIGYKF